MDVPQHERLIRNVDPICGGPGEAAASSLVVPSALFLEPMSMGCLLCPIATDPHAAPSTRASSRMVADRMKARVHSHPVDHTPSVTAPGVVVDLILDAIRDNAP
jgi:hypothetical protein